MNENKEQHNSLREFVKILIKYMKEFGLEPIDIAFLAFTNRINIENLIELNGSLELERMEAIAQAFNLRHYQFSNPQNKMPKLNDLPERTRQRIAFRKLKGAYIPETKKSTNINNKIAIAISFLNINSKFLTEEICLRINTVDSDTLFTTTLVGDRLAKSFSQYVQKTTESKVDSKKVGAKPFFYKVIAKIPEEELNQSIEAVGTYWFEAFKEKFVKT